MDMSQSLFYWKLLCNNEAIEGLLSYLWVTILVLLETPLQLNKVFFYFMSLAKSQSLFYWKLLCNWINSWGNWGTFRVTILVLLETPLQYKVFDDVIFPECVTILVLLETPLQYYFAERLERKQKGHNPCFTGNSFAMKNPDFIKETYNGHNPCFTGNSFAIWWRVQ